MVRPLCQFCIYRSTGHDGIEPAIRLLRMSLDPAHFGTRPASPPLDGTLSPTRQEIRIRTANLRDAIRGTMDQEIKRIIEDAGKITDEQKVCTHLDMCASCE